MVLKKRSVYGYAKIISIPNGAKTPSYYNLTVMKGAVALDMFSFPTYKKAVAMFNDINMGSVITDYK